MSRRPAKPKRPRTPDLPLGTDPKVVRAQAATFRYVANRNGWGLKEADDRKIRGILGRVRGQ